MSPVPADPKIYHITHVKNLPGMIREGVIWSDAQRIIRQLECEVVGMADVKNHRRTRSIVKCHPDSKVGHYVPFNFCARSVMLYILHQNNHASLTHSDGQEPMIHLRADLRTVVRWADTMKRRWAFTDQNARSELADFHCDLAMLDRVNWTAVNATYWPDSGIMQAKQAEFLLEDSFPLNLIEGIAVCDAVRENMVKTALAAAGLNVSVRISRGCYYRTSGWRR